MKDGLLERIRSIGHWRVNLRPVTALPTALSFQRCNQLVEDASVSIRGWDFPHVSRRNDNDGGRGNVGDYAESWTDWNGFHEFWRMYKSAQFIFIGGLYEDTQEWGDGCAPGEILNAVSAIYSISEFVEFAARLSKSNVYADGMDISISLLNSEGRHLSAGRGRVPFFEPKVCAARDIVIKRRTAASQLSENSREISLDIVLELFDNFGWNPDPSRVKGDQEKFFRREFSA